MTTTTDTVYRLIDELRAALLVSAAAEVQIEKITAAQAAADQAWADVSRLRKELWEAIQADAAECLGS